jgi:Fe-S oxidoreductase
MHPELWIHHGINRLFYGFVVAGSLFFFAWVMRNRVRAILAGPQDARWDHLGHRIQRTLAQVFGHLRMFRRPLIGPVHAIIFWGFCVLTLGTLNFLLDGVFPGWQLPGSSSIFFRFSQDTFTFLVIVAVLLAYFRRFAIRPAFVRLSWDANVILLFILLLMITDLWVDALTSALTHDLPLGAWMLPWIHSGLALSSWTEPNLQLFLTVGWWAHLVTLLGFLCYLPFSKHFHVITAVPNIFFSTQKPWGRMTKLDLENSQRFGAEKLEHLSWKQKLDTYACTECGRCSSVCPATHTGKLLDPANIIIHLRDHLVHGDVNQSVHGPVVTEQELWACTTCAACMNACPLFIEHVPTITDLRRHLVLMEGQMPVEATQALRNMESQSNPWGLSPELREKWMDEAQVKPLNPGQQVEVLLWVGCAGAMDERSKKIILAMVKILKHADISFGVIGKKESCTGDSARRIGNEYLFQQLAVQNVESLNQVAYERMVTVCPHCFNTFKNEYSEFGLNSKPVIHHTEYLKTLLETGKLALKASDTATQVTLHDSCYLTRYNGIVEAPRAVLGAIPSTLLTEMGRRKTHNFCCGAGGGRMWMEEKEGTPVNQNRAREAVQTGAEVVITECPFCMTMMTDGTQAVSKDKPMQVLDLAEWVAFHLPTPSAAAPPQPSKTHVSL